MADNPFLASPFDFADEPPKAKPVEMEDAPAPRPVKAKSAEIYQPAAVSRSSIREYARRRAEELGVDPDLATSIMIQESGGNPNVRNSPKGAVGVGQVMPATYRMMMGTSEGIDDPYKNIEAGLRYIAYGQKKIGTKDPALLAAGYHSGMDRKELRQGIIPNTNDGMIDTRDYAASVARRLGRKRPVDDEFSDTPLVSHDDFEDEQFRTKKDEAATNRLSYGMPRDEYERVFRVANPGAKQAAVDYAMQGYDQAQAQRTEAGGNAVQKRFDTMQNPEAMFEERLNKKLGGDPNGVVPGLPTPQQLADSAKQLPLDQDRAIGEASQRTLGGRAADAASYLGSSLKAGLYDVAGASAKILDEINPWTLSESDAGVLFKDDPEKLKEMQDGSAAMILSRFAHSMQKKGGEAAQDMSPGAKLAYGNLEYATTDLNKSAFTSPIKVIGDATRSLPTMAAMAVSAYVTRGAANRAYASAIEAGLSHEAATLAAIQAGSKVMGATSAATEGGVGYAQQSLQTADDLNKLSDADWAKSPAYQKLVASGYAPAAAKARVIADTSEQAGQIAGIVDASVNKVGGEFLGKIISEGGKFIPRVMKGAATEAVTEGVQSPGEQFGQNWATKQNVNPNQSLSEGTGEAALQGVAVGGLSGGAAAGAAGGAHHASASAPASQASATPPIAPAQPTDPVVPVASTPSQASGPLGRASENAATEPQRVTVETPQGAVSGDVVAQSRDGKVIQLVDDEGNAFTVQTGAEGIKITEEKPNAPLSNALEQAADEHAGNQDVSEQAATTEESSPVEEVAQEQEIQEDPGEDVAAETQQAEEQTAFQDAPEKQAAVEDYADTTTPPADQENSLVEQATQQTEDEFSDEPIKTVERFRAHKANVAEMDDAELRARLKYVASMGKTNGWTKMLSTARQEVETEINTRARAAEKAARAAKIAQATPTMSDAATPAAVKQSLTTEEGAKPAAKKPAKAKLDTIAKGTVFPSSAKAKAFITKNGLGDTHQVEKTGKVRFEIKAKPAEGMVRFEKDSGTLGIPRAEMPQIPTEAHGGMVRHLNAQGIEHETKMVDAAELKPTQAEFSPEGVERAKEATGDRAVIVAKDGHIIDGHHQALAAKEDGKDVKAIVIDAPIEEALEVVKNSPSAQTVDEPNAEKPAKKERLYHVVAINEKAGNKTVMTREPVTHDEAVTIKSKISDHPARRVQLDEVSAPVAKEKSGKKAAKADKTEPKAQRKPSKAKQEAAARDAAIADYYTPGNIVRSYGGSHDEVLAFKKTDDGFVVRVQRVRKDGDDWVRVGKAHDDRQHSTKPDAKQLAAGPIARLPHAEGAVIRYTEPRADGKQYQNAPSRGEKAEEKATKATEPAFSRRKAESLPDTIKVDGKDRPTTNSNGKPIAETEEGVKNFWKWFGDSKVVDKDGKPLVVYHGTEAELYIFDTDLVGTNFGQDTRGFFFTDNRKQAESYARNTSYGLPRDDQGHVMATYLSLRNPLIEKIDYDPINEWDDRHIELQRKAATDSHDGVIIKAEKGESLYIAFNPEQIKSSSGNRGTFDPANPDIRFRRDVANAVAPSRVADVERAAEDVAKGWANKPDVVVVNGMQDPNVPAEVRAADEAQRQGGAKGEPEGFIYQGKVYVNAAEVAPADVARVMYHEALGHYGLRGVFGDALKPQLAKIVQLRKKDVLAKAKEYGLDTKDKEALLHAAEEVLADMAEKTPTIGFVKNAVAAIRSFLRKNVPGFANMRLTDAEIIRDFLMPARGHVQRGVVKGPNWAAAFSRTETGETENLPDTITVDGEERSTTNSDGKPIAATEKGVRNFWKWFGDSDAVDAEGRPLVVYHGTPEQFTVFNNNFTGENTFGNASDEAYAATAMTGHWFNSGEIKEAENSPYGSYVDTYLKIENPLHLDSLDDLAETLRPYLPENAADDFDAMKEAVNGWVEEQTDDGYDGIVLDDEEFGGTSYVVFAPEQIKSASKNTGAFDPSTPDIRFKRSESMPEETTETAKPEDTGLTPPEQGLLRRIQSAVQDRMNRVRQVQDRIEKQTGLKLPEYSDHYGAETLRPGRIASRKEDFEHLVTGPLMEKLAKSGHTMDDLTELLHAMHAQERNEAVARINDAMPDGGSGMLTAVAEKILEKFKDNKTLHKLADEARAIAKATLDMKLAYGMIDKETYDALTKAYKYYVPLKGDGEFGPKVKRAMGHETREERILDNLARDYEQALVSGEKNKARQALLQMVLENPDENLWTVGMPPKGRYVAGKTYTVSKNGNAEATFTSPAQVSAYLEAKGAEASQYDVRDSKGEKVAEFTKPLQDNEVPVYVDGRPLRIQIHDEKLARQLRPLDQGQMNAILESMRGMNRYLSSIYTGKNPSFLIRNTVRDAITGTVNMLGREGIGTAAKAWKHYPAALASLGKYSATGKVSEGQMGKYLREYREQGGKTGASWMSDLETHRKSLERMYEDARGAGAYVKDGKPTKAALIAGRKIIGSMARVVEIGNEATENALRLALYSAMRDKGATPSAAAQAAKQVTVDFDRKGSMTGVLGAIYLFLNPAIQGTANGMKTLTQGKHKGQAWAALGALATLGMYAAGKGMDDDKDRWLGEGWESRSKNFIMKAGDHSIKVPISQEFAPFYALGVAMAEGMRGERKTAAAARAVSSFIDAYFPLQGAYSPDSDNPGMDLVGAAMPTIIKPAFQSVANRSSFGSQIVPETEQSGGKPDNLKMYRGTKGTAYDTAAQAIAKAGEAMGAGKYEDHITKISPETLKHYWRTYTGGLGAFIADSMGVARMGVDDPAALKATDVPIIRDFVKERDVKAIRGRFYEISKEAKDASEEFRLAKKAGDAEEIDNILSRPGQAELIGLAKMMTATSKAAAKLRDESVEINANKSLTTTQKRAALKELEAQEETIYRGALDAFK